MYYRGNIFDAVEFVGPAIVICTITSSTLPGMIVSAEDVTISVTAEYGPEIVQSNDW